MTFEKHFRQKINRVKSIIFYFIPLFFYLTGCSGLRIQKVIVQNPSQYKFNVENEGLIIAVDPFSEEDRLKNFFGIDLLSKGILPVFIVFKNLSSEDGFILLKEQSNLVLKDNKERNNLCINIVRPIPYCFNPIYGY